MKLIPLKDQIDPENDNFFLVEYTIEKSTGTFRTQSVRTL